MVHFIIEHFGMGLDEAVSRQRLFASIVRDLLQSQSGKSLAREGDDLYLSKTRAKLSISIATASPVSSLIHFAFNVSNDGTPVKTAALKDLGLEKKWESLAKAICQAYQAEHASILEASCKVRWVK
jgi:uncharacterized protein